MHNLTPAPRKNVRPRHAAGFTLVEIMIVVLVIGVLLNIALPSLVSARDRSQARSCVKNMNDFMVAKEQYAMDGKIAANSATSVTWANLSPYVRSSPNTSVTLGPTCPSSSTNYYNFNPISLVPTCSYYQSTYNAGNPLALHTL